METVASNNPGWIKVLFAVGALYDAILGAAFLFARDPIMQSFAIEPPNHPGYVQFPALLLLLFAGMYMRIASNPGANRALIPFGAGLKVAYCATVFWNAATGSIPAMWVTLAWVDFAFLAAFLVAWKQLEGRTS